MSKTGMAAILCVAFLSWPAAAAEIYRDTDASGRTVYSDRPVSTNANKLRIKSRATDPAALESEKALLAERQAKREEAKKQAATEAERNRDIQAQRAQNCEKARNYQARVEASHRLYEVDDNGNRRYYSSAEQDAALEKARTQVREWCDN